MDFKEYLKITKNFRDESGIKEIFKNISQEEIIELLENIKKYYQAQDGMQLMLATELEKIILNIPDNYLNIKETSNLLKLYQEFNNNSDYEGICHTRNIEKNIFERINKLYHDNFERSISNYFRSIIQCLKSCDTQKKSVSPLIKLFSITLISKGYKIGIIKPGSNDEKIYNFVCYGLPTVFLLKKILLKTLSNSIPYDSFFINNTDKKLLENSIESFKKEDYITSLSLIVPRIESILREIIKKKGGTDLIVKSFKKNRYFAHKTFSDCLNSVEIQEFFSKEMILLLKAIFSNNYGLNIRNELAHGLLDASEYTEAANIIILIVILYIVSSEI